MDWVRATIVDAYFGSVWAVRLLLQRGLAAIYVVAFLTVLLQFKPLLGEKGLLPVPTFLKRAGFREAPSLFYWKYSDRLLEVVAWAGLILSGCAVLGLTEAGPFWVSMGAWLLIWFLYLSIVNVGQTFFGFGWESMLLEAGFFAAFLGPTGMEPSILPVLVLRWMLFRTELGAGLIKLRHDPCWRDLTCLYYHYETQPLPNGLSWYFHLIPRPLHRLSALFSHFVQVIVPFGLFAPQPIASIAAGLIIFQQLWLIISGNYSWLNWLTVVLGLSGFSDRVLAGVHLYAPTLHARPMAFSAIIYLVAAMTVVLSVQPTLNLLSKHQRMNYSYNRFHLVNAYGAFGNVGKERYEIVIEGTDEPVMTAHTQWREYGFKGKPGDPMRTPPQVAPYHLRLDWMIWFLPFSVVVTGDEIRVPGFPLWFLRFVHRLLAGDQAIVSLLRKNPFVEKPPVYIRAVFYRYRYTDPHEKRATGAWWKRQPLGIYLPPLSLETLRDVC